MAKHDQYFKTEFDRLAVNGFIGRPDGKPAYAYIRVSSDEQGEEGRSGLPRQIEHIHERALQAGYCIQWDRVFADDFTGFELERPELAKLRREYRSPQRRAFAVVMEHLDRLSRNADWHQGFLLDEMKQAEIAPVFWKTFSSRIERAVMGAVAQEGMEQARERMTEGMLRKARGGRVTAHQAAYGYRLVDDHGDEGERAKKMSYYALHDDRAAIMRTVYQRVASGDTLIRIAADLTAAHVPPPKRHRVWEGTVLRIMIVNPVYKGEFIAHRWIDVKIQKPSKDGLSMRTVTHRRARPEDEWIRVPVPPIVEAALWQAANDMLAKNKQMASRNAHHQFLLTGLIKCSDCGYTYTGTTQRKAHGKLLTTPNRGYRCSNASVLPKHMRNIHVCKQSYITAYIVEDAVWSVVCNEFMNPKVLLAALESDVFNEQNASVERQIAYLEREIDARGDEDEKLYKAYMAGVFDADEYAARRGLVKADAARMKAELAALYPQQVTRAHFEAQRVVVMQFAERLRGLDVHSDPPFELKQHILKMTVNKIVLNARDKWFRLEGVVRGTYPIENTPVDRDNHNVTFEVLFSLADGRVVSVSTLPNVPVRKLDKGGRK